MTDSQPPIDPDRMLTPKEAARWLGYSPRTLERWRQNPDHPLRWSRLGGGIRYSERDIKAFVRAGRRKASERRPPDQSDDPGRDRAV